MCSAEPSISLLWSENVRSVLCFYKHLAALRPATIDFCEKDLVLEFN
jgi:hypothetical protein